MQGICISYSPFHALLFSENGGGLGNFNAIHNMWINPKLIAKSKELLAPTPPMSILEIEAREMGEDNKWTCSNFMGFFAGHNEKCPASILKRLVFILQKVWALPIHFLKRFLGFLQPSCRLCHYCIDIKGKSWWHFDKLSFRRNFKSNRIRTYIPLLMLC